MTNKKYLPSVIVLYLNYFLHGIGCSVLGQAVIKDALAASWNVEAMAITAIAAALGLGRLIALPFAGPLSDKLGRRVSTAIGGFSYAVYLIGLAMAFNAGGGAGYRIAYICAIVGGIANSFLDTGIYPAVAEIINKAPGVATMGIKFAISGSQFLLPFFLGITVGQTAGGLVSYNKLFFIVGIAYLVLMALILFFPLPDTDKKEGEKKEGLLQSIKHANFSAGSIAMILIGFTCTGTFQLWLNCAQNFAKDVAGWAEYRNNDRTRNYSSSDKQDQRRKIRNDLSCSLRTHDGCSTYGSFTGNAQDRRFRTRLVRSRRTSADRNIRMQHALP